MRVLVTGGAGMLGRDLDTVLRQAGHEVTLARRSDLDVTALSAVRSAVAEHDLVVNAAAWTAVDDAETHEAEAFAVNAIGASYVAHSCAERDVPLVHVSTDYVFDGTAQAPYPEDAPVSPRSAYGRSKAAGEWAVRSAAPRSWIVRTAWLYGAGGPNFVATMAGLAARRETLSVVTDQRGQPTWTTDLARAIRDLVRANAPWGTYHGTASGEATKQELAREVFQLLGLDPARVLPTTSDAFPAPAPRPAYSVLGHDAWRAAGLEPLPDWRASLATSVREVVGATPALDGPAT